MGFFWVFAIFCVGVGVLICGIFFFSVIGFCLVFYFFFVVAY